jgi:hypothetical protein
MTNTRQRLPDRRACETRQFEHAGFTYVASIGRFANGELAEVFLSGPKIGTDVQAAAQDSSIVASLALQFGCHAETIRHAIGRNSDGTVAGPLGKLLDLLAKETAK